MGDRAWESGSLKGFVVVGGDSGQGERSVCVGVLGSGALWAGRHLKS